MTWHMSVGILCSADPSVKAKSQVSLYASWGCLILKMQHSTTRQTKQKICANLDHHWSKKCSFLCVQTKWVGLSGTQRFCKNDSDSSLESLTVTRVESRHSVKNVTRVHLTLEPIEDFCDPNPVQYFQCVIQSDPNPAAPSKHLIQSGLYPQNPSD